MTGLDYRQRALVGRLLIAFVTGLPTLIAAQPLATQLRALQLDVPRQRLPAPGFELPDLRQRTIRLADTRGKLVVLNFWATFCQPCRDEMPALAALAEAFKARGLVVLAVAVDRGNRDTVQAFARAHAIAFDVALDPDGKVRKVYDINALPTSYLIGRDGRFIARAVGGRRWDSPAFRALIDTLLRDDSPPPQAGAGTKRSRDTE